MNFLKHALLTATAVCLMTGAFCQDAPDPIGADPAVKAIPALNTIIEKIDDAKIIVQNSSRSTYPAAAEALDALYTEYAQELRNQLTLYPEGDAVSVVLKKELELTEALQSANSSAN